MRVAVISPVSHGTGASCISLLLGLRLGHGTDRVCVTHTHPTDSSLRDAAGVIGSVDKTTTPSMIIRTFQSVSTMTEQEYAQYCAAVTRDVDLFTCTRAGDAACTQEDSMYLAGYVASKFPHKHVVIDVDTHAEEIQNEIIKVCDVVVFTARVSRNEINMLRSKLEQYKKSGILAGKKVAILFNRWHGAVVKQKELSRMLGIHQKFVYILPFNEYIAWAEFNRKFPQMWQFVVKGDSRVLPVRVELDRLINGLRQQKVTDAGAAKNSKLFGVKHADLENKESATSSVVRSVTQDVKVESSTNHTQMISAGLPAGFGTPQATGFVATKPVNSVPAPSVPTQVAPVESVPAQVAPVESVPAQVAPVESVPAQVASVQSVPAQVAPVQSAPAQVAPVQSAPAQVAPVQVAPVKPSPEKVAPVESAPVQVAPVKPSPEKVAPVGSVPAQVAPVESAPVQVAPVQSAPAQVAPAQFVSTQVASAQDSVERTSTSLDAPLSEVLSDKGDSVMPKIKNPQKPSNIHQTVVNDVGGMSGAVESKLSSQVRKSSSKAGVDDSKKDRKSAVPIGSVPQPLKKGGLSSRASSLPSSTTPVSSVKQVSKPISKPVTLLPAIQPTPPRSSGQKPVSIGGGK